MEFFVGISGASGAPYALGVVKGLLAAGHKVGVSFSTSGTKVAGHELYGDLHMDPEEVIDRFCVDAGLPRDDVWGQTDWSSPYASGSARWEAAIVVPCSMSTLATIATGAGDNLIHRAASVALKEQRRLIVVPRETPLSMIHLENMTRLASAGAIIAPAMPAHYTQPQTVEDMNNFMIGKILNLVGVEQSALAEWRPEESSK